MPKAGAIQRIFHVELKIYIEGFEEHTYFGSKKAIFDYFEDKTLGITYSSFMAKGMRDNYFENSRCIIREGFMRTAHKSKVPKERTKMLTEYFGKSE